MNLHKMQVVLLKIRRYSDFVLFSAVVLYSMKEMRRIPLILPILSDNTYYLRSEESSVSMFLRNTEVFLKVIIRRHGMPHLCSPSETILTCFSAF